MTPDLRAFALTDFEALVQELGERPFRARQLFRWVHRRGAASLDELTDLPASLRRALAARTRLTVLRCDLAQEAADGTIKYRLRTADDRLIEAVFMPEARRRTLCVSTQVGCAMGCGFCRTATMGLVRNLTRAEIVDQVHRVNRDLLARGFPGTAGDRVLSNLVFMGMGEPLHNLDEVLAALDLLMDPLGLDFSHRHVTVSTSGLVPEIGRFGRECRAKLAISLNGTTDAQREAIMPVNRKYPIAELLAACRAFPVRQGRRITFEYVLLAGVNDTALDADRLVRLLEGMAAKVNLIAYNDNPGLGFKSPAPQVVSAFLARLLRQGLAATLRKNRGRDIAGACGQLAVEGLRPLRVALDRAAHGPARLASPEGLP